MAEAYWVPLVISTGLNLLSSLFTPKQKEQEVALRVPRSDYGSPLVKIYGRVRIEGNKFWPDTKEKMYRKSRSSRKGKGGGGRKGGQKKDSYFGTFSVLFCQGICNIEKLIINGDNYDINHKYYQEYVTFFNGNQTSPWSEMTAKDESPYKDIAYTNICYVGFSDLPLEKYGNQIPQQISAVLVDDGLGANPLLRDVITNICVRAGIVSDLLDVSDLGDIRLDGGFIVPESGEGYRKILEDLFQMFLMTAIETKEGIIKFVRFGSTATSSTVTLNDYFPVSANGIDNKLFTKNEINPSQIPNQVSIKFFNVNKSYDSDEVTEYTDALEELQDIDFVKENNVTIDSRYFCSPEQMRVSALNLLRHIHRQQRYEYNLKLPATVLSGSSLELLNTIALPNGEIVQVEQIALGADYLLDIKARYFTGETVYSNPPPPDISPNPVPDPTTDIPELYVVDVPVFKENTNPGTLYVFSRKECSVLISLDGGASYNKDVSHDGISTYGNVLTVLANGSGLDIINTVDVELESGEVNAITDAQLETNLNLAVLGTLNGGAYEGEIIQFRDVQVLTATTFRLSYLKRGLYQTGYFSDKNVLPQRFFLLTAETGAYYSELQGDSRYVGETLTLMPVVATYQNLATTPTYTVTPRGNSYRPSNPTNATGTIDEDGNITIFWDYDPPFSPFNNSTEGVTYDVMIVASNRLIQSNLKQCNYLIADRTTDGVGTTFDVLIYAVSSVVGRGNPLEATIVPVLLPNEVIGTGGGLRGIKRVTSAYTVTEYDVGFVIVVQTALIEEINVTFPSTLSNGFYCYVVNDRNNNRSALVSIVVPNSYTFASNNRIPNGKVRSVIHVSLGNYFIEGENSLFYDYVGDVANNGVLDANIWYELQGNRTFLLPTNPRESNMIGIRGMNGVDFADTPITINGNGELIEGNSTFVMNQTDERIILYFNGLQWIFISRYAPNIELIQDAIADSLVAGTNITLDYDDNANTITISSTGGGTGTGLGFAYQEINFTAVANTIYAINTLNNPVTATLPTSPSSGSIVSFYDYSSSFATNSLTIASGGGDNIVGNSTIILDTANSTVQLIFYLNKWSVFGTEVFVDMVGGTGTIPDGELPFATIQQVIDESLDDVIVSPLTLGVWMEAQYTSSTDVLNDTIGDEIVSPLTLAVWADAQGFLTVVPDATDSVKGIAMKATLTEAQNRLNPDGNKFITPATLPVADYGTPGLAEPADNNAVLGETDTFRYVTPAGLKRWRIDNNIEVDRTVVITTNIYVSGNAYHSLSGIRRGDAPLDPNHGDSVTYAQYVANQNDINNDGNYWQVFDPSAPNFRCFKTLKDVSDYGNANLKSSDSLVLYMDAGKYRCDYTFNFGLTINGVNNLGASTWGDGDGVTNLGIILYVTPSYSVDPINKAINYNSRSMVVSSSALVKINYVHFWSWVTATKDSSLSWDNNLKAIGQNTIEQYLLNVDAVAFAANQTVLREKYLGSFYGVGRYSPVLILREEGEKNLDYCTFSGVGTSEPKVNLIEFNGGYISIQANCLLSIVGIVLRGNEEIRISDKRGRKVTTALSPTPVYIPPDNGEKADSDNWTFDLIYDESGNFRSSCIGVYDLKSVFHDPYAGEWVSIGFCDYFIGIGENVELKLKISGSFSNNLSYFGSYTPALFNSFGVDIDGSFTLNHDTKNIRIEKNQGKLFGLTDDRVIGGSTSSLLTNAENKLRYRGTDTLGKKMSSLFPPVLTYLNGDVTNKNEPVNLERDAFQEWVTDFSAQGSTIRSFFYSSYNYSFQVDGEYSLWADRDCRGYITGQGFVGQCGYLLRTNNVKIQPILAHDFFSGYSSTNNSSSYGQGLVFNVLGTGSKLLVGNQYQYNIFKPVWTGFNNGRFIHPVIVDVGTDYSTYLGEIQASTPIYTSIVTEIEAMGIVLDGSIVGARFVMVGVNNTEKIGLMYLGYSNDTIPDHYFMILGNTVGVNEYFNALKINSINDLSTITGDPSTLYIRDSNLLLQRENYSVDVTDIRNWQPMNLVVDSVSIHNASNLGLVGHNYKTGFYVDKYGINTNLTNYSAITEAQITKSLTLIYSGAGYPDSLDVLSSDYETLLAMLDSGFYARSEFSGFSVILFSTTVQVTG